MPSRLVPAATIGALALFILISFSSVSLAQSAPTVEEFDLSPNVTAIDAMAIDGSGNVWMVDTAGSTLYMYNVSSSVLAEHHFPSALILQNSQFTGMSVDDTGVVWIADKGGNRIVAYVPGQNYFQPYSLPKDLQLDPSSVIRYGDSLWIGMNMEIGRLDITSPELWLIDSYVSSSYKAGISDIKIDGAGNVWFVEYNTGKVGKHNVYADKDDTTEYTIPTNGSYPTCLGIDSQKRLWFVESQPNKLGMFDTMSNGFMEYDAPTLDGLRSSLNRIAVDGNDNVWLTDTANGRLVKYYPAKNVSVPVYLGNKKGYPTLLSIDANGYVWVIESGTKKLAKVHADPLYGLSGTVTPTVTPTPTAAAGNQTATATAKPTPGFEAIAGVSALIAALCLLQRKR